MTCERALRPTPRKKTPRLKAPWKKMKRLSLTRVAHELRSPASRWCSSARPPCMTSKKTEQRPKTMKNMRILNFSS